ncbi:MAG TPA: trypsin-like peptidase domain-containing protein [Byssovorax sp.]
MALRLVSTDGRGAAEPRTLSQDVVRVGRAEDNDVVIEAPAADHHAEVLREGTRWVLVDLGNDGGTWVGGQRVDRHELVSGEEVIFGAGGPALTLSIVDDEPAPGDVAPSKIADAPAEEAAALADDETAPADDAPPSRRTKTDPMLAIPNMEPAGVHAAASTLPSKTEPGAPPASRNILLAPPAGSMPGTRTIGEMITRALRQDPASEHLAAHVHATRDEHRRNVRILSGLLVVALIAVVALAVRSVRSQAAIDKLQRDLADVGARPHIAGQPPALASESFGRQLYEKYKKGIFMLAANGHGFCTAFAVRPNVLATNAHCAEHAQQEQSVVALENEGRGRVSFRMISAKAHPWFRSSRNDTVPPDVGVVYIQGRASTVLQLATPQELTHTGAGDEIYLLGFPGRLMDAQNPAATFLAAHVGRVTNAHGQPSTFAQAWLIEHDAQTTPGTSGSPIFDAHGKVIAINEGSYRNQGDQREGPSDSPYKIAIRIDLLNQLLQ